MHFSPYKMNTPLFKQYHNSSDLISLDSDLISLQQVKDRISELTRSLNQKTIIFQSEIQDEIDNEIQTEIDFYKMQIWCFERGEGEYYKEEDEIKLLKHKVSKLEDTVALLIRIIKEK